MTVAVARAFPLKKSQPSLENLTVRHGRQGPYTTWGRESLQPLLIRQSEFDDFDVCRLMAEKAMHDRDYRAQLERLAYGHIKATELSAKRGDQEKHNSAPPKAHEC